MAMQFLPGSLEIENNPYDCEVWKFLSELFSKYDGCCAYKIPVLGAHDVGAIPTFVVFTNRHGLVLIDIVSDELQEIHEDGRIWKLSERLQQSRDVALELYIDEIYSRFKRSPFLFDRRKREHLVPSHQFLIFMENSEENLNELRVEEFIQEDVFPITGDSYPDAIRAKLESVEWDGDSDQLDDIFSLLEGTWDYLGDLQPVDKTAPLKTMNSLIQMSLDRTFKQDNSQRQVSMQIPNGPQRIRGLAGTGKTVVLCLKAALTVLRMKEYKILYLFNTQSLYHMIEQKIGNYYAKEAKSALPKDRIDIFHAWGGRTTGEGLYSKICNDYGISPMALRDVPWGVDALEYIYKKLTMSLGEKITPIYDMVLIDEAQDFPNEVFELVYHLTKDPKRIVIAYDDFQSLKRLKIREFNELFGENADGSPRFTSESLEGDYAGGIAKDFVLPNCYRNPRNVLMVAHGVALGVKREGGVVDSVDKRSDWEALGYNLLSPQKNIIEADDNVEVERPDKNSANLLERLIAEQEKKPDNLVQVSKHESKDDEIESIAQKIRKLVSEQEVAPHNIYVITLDTKNSQVELGQLRSKLNEYSINSISPGFVESARSFYREGCVVLTTAYRAKGNEANIVFVMSCDGVVRDLSFMKRNSFFVSVTRSRGWCYISGTGEGMEKLHGEIRAIQSEIPRFKYIRPSDESIARRRIILSKSDAATEKQQKLIEKLLEQNPDLVKELMQQAELFNNEHK